MEKTNGHKSDATTIEQYIHDACAWDEELSLDYSDEDILRYFSLKYLWGRDQSSCDARWTFEELGNRAIEMRDELIQRRSRGNDVA